MKPAQKQLALKAGLLVILATNVSWGTHKTLQSSDFASNGKETGLSGAAATGVNIQPPPPPPPPTAADEARAKAEEKARAALSTTNVKAGTYENQKFCAIDFKIHFVEIQEDGKSVFHAYVTRQPEGIQYDGFKQINLTYKDVMGDPAKKAKWDAAIKKRTVARLENEGENCDDSGPQVVQAPQTPSGPQQTAPQDTRRDEIARGLRNCTLDIKGELLHGEDKFKCNLKRLELISLDQPTDDDDSIDTDRGVRRRRLPRKRDNLAAVEAVLRPLETSIKSLLLDPRDARREMGEERLADVITALQTVAETASTPADQRAITKLIDGLDKAYPLGEKVNEKAELYSDKLAAIDDKMSELKAATVGANMYQQMAINQQLQNLQTQRLNTLQIANGDPDYMNLRRYTQTGLISQTDFGDFTNDFNLILRQVSGNSALGQGTLGLAQSPADIMNLRNQALSQDPRNYNLGNIAYPQINYQALGLQNPSIAGAPVAPFPTTTAFPQATSLPVTNPGFPAPFQSTTPGFPNPAFAPTTLPQTAQLQPGLTSPSIFTTSTIPGRF